MGWRERGSHLWREWLKPLLVVAFVVGAFRSTLADWNDVPTGSMRPTIIDGDRVFVDRAAYDLRVPFTRVRMLELDEPQPGDIVVFLSPRDGKRLVKRIVGGPGDRLELRGGRLFVNGRPASYAAMDQAILESLPEGEREGRLAIRESVGDGPSHPVLATLDRFGAPRFFGPVVVPANSYFMMGDNRDESADSREFGFVARDRILGRATAVALSVDLDHWLMPRWERFFKKLS